MHIVMVSLHVRPESINELLAVTLENIRETLKEEGVRRFDLLRQAEDPARFLLVEVYLRAEDHARHKDTAHYKRWAAAAEPLMVEPRTRIVYQSVFPKESGWE
ncbi:MAG: antibiotic biosynthesis monooxygenase [Chloroflexota bacterium]